MLAFMKQFLLVITAALFIAASCGKKGITPPGPVTPTTPAEDTILHKMIPFKMGAAINVNLMQSNTKYSALVKKEFNSITAENAMKFGSLHPTATTYNWAPADYLINFAKLNNMRVHGHTLIWHQSLPTWVENFVGDSAAWENLAKTHIQTVVGYFKGKVVSWDVVNEAFNDDGTMRNSIWRQKLGEDYIARFFQYAHQADSACLLFYNDYGHEYSSAKRSAISNMLQNFKSRNIPVHGIGMQFHTSISQSESNTTAAITAAKNTGLLVHISELDVSINPGGNQSIVYTSTLGNQQAAKYKSIFKSYSTLVPAAQQFGITQWNLTDADSWIPAHYSRPDWPLPFDRNYNRKPAYAAMIEGVK